MNFYKNVEIQTIFKKIRPYYESDLIKVITGIRRCGKSVILSRIIDEIKDYVDEDHIIMLNLESIQDRKINSCDKLEGKIISLIKDDLKYYIFIDEIQNIRNFEMSLSRYLFLPFDFWIHVKMSPWVVLPWFPFWSAHLFCFFDFFKCF